MSLNEEGIPAPPYLPSPAQGSARATAGLLVAVGICFAFFLIMLFFFVRHQQGSAGDPILIITPTNTLDAIATSSHAIRPTMLPTATRTKGGKGGGGIAPTATPKPTPTATRVPPPTPTATYTRVPQ